MNLRNIVCALLIGFSIDVYGNVYECPELLQSIIDNHQGNPAAICYFGCYIEVESQYVLPKWRCH